MTEQEAFEALQNSRPVSAKVRVSLDMETFNFQRVHEIHYYYDKKEKKIKCCVQLLQHNGRSVSTVPVEDVEYLI